MLTFTYYPYLKFTLQCCRALLFVLVLICLLFMLVFTETALCQEPFLWEESPAPFDQSKLLDIDVDPEGRIVAVGWQRELVAGGSPLYPLVMIKDPIQNSWTILDPPNFGWTYYELWAVKFIPETNGDFVAVGEYLPDPLIASAHGILLRYHKDSGNWDLHSFQAPGALFHFIRDAAFDPDDPNRLMIVGTRGIADAGGFCFEFTTMVVDYHIDTYTYSVIPTTQRGGLWTIAALTNGNFITAGIAAGDCDYLPYPVILEVEEELEIIHPNPPPTTSGYWYSITALTTLNSGDIFMVGGESFFGGSNFHTLAFKYNPVTQIYQSFKPLDPDTTESNTNNLWDVVECPNGKIYAVGRTHYIYQNLHYRRAMIQSFDGETWKLHPLPTSFGEGHYSELWGMTMLANGQIYTVGHFRPISSFDPQTLVMHNEIITAVFDSANFSMGTPKEYSLQQNYPNPFNPSTKINWQSPVGTHQSLIIYNVLGKEVETLVNEFRPAGKYEIVFNADGLPSGVYFYQLKIDTFLETRKMILIK